MVKNGWRQIRTECTEKINKELVQNFGRKMSKKGNTWKKTGCNCEDNIKVGFKNTVWACEFSSSWSAVSMWANRFLHGVPELLKSWTSWHVSENTQIGFLT